MAERNVAINGKQIKAAVAADGLMKDASQNLAVDVSDFAGTGLEDDGSENLRIAASAAGDGLTGGAGSALAVGAGDGIDVAADAVAVDVTDIIDTAYGLVEDTNNIRISLKANDGLKFGTVGDAGKLMIDYDDTTIGIIANVLAVKADAITEAKLAMGNSPTSGYYIKYVTDHMEWASISDIGFAKADIIANEIPSGAIGGNTDFVLDFTPATGSLQVYLNGLLQEPGSGKDYMLSAATITFAAAPDVGNIVIANYVKA
jgi:hypothetical protein